MLKLTKALAHETKKNNRFAIFVFGLVICANSLNAQSADTKAYKKSSEASNTQADTCTTIKDATKRANCFESIVRTQINPTKAPTQNTSQSKPDSTNSELKKAITEIKSIRVTKDEFETKTDYFKRIEELSKKYTGQKYVLNVPCKQRDKQHKSLVSYDAENSELVVSFPDFDSQLGFLSRNGELTTQSIKYSYFPIEETDEVIDKYRASNAFGAQIDVTKIRLKSIGAAVLVRGNNADILSLMKLNLSQEEIVRRLPKPDEFRFKASPDAAKEILQSCTVSIQVESVLSDLFELMTTGRNFVTTILLEEQDESKPTLSNSVHLITEHAALPVRLISVELQPKKGQATFRADAVER